MRKYTALIPRSPSASRLLLLCVSLAISMADLRAEDPGERELPADLTYDWLYANPGFWPSHVSLTEPLETERGQIPDIRFPGILIRLETERVMIDFGRHGIARVAPEQTDLLERTRQLYRDGRDEMNSSNIHALIGNKLFDRNLNFIPFNQTGGSRQWAFLFTRTDTPGIGDVIDRIDQELAAADSGAEDETQVVLFVLDSNRSETNAFVAAHQPGFLSVLPHMADSYSDVFGLLEPGSALPQLVLLHPNGKVLQHYDAENLLDTPPDSPWLSILPE